MTTYIKNDSKHQDPSVIAERISGVNYKLKQKASLYWITDDRTQDPKSYGYIGVTTRDNLEAHFKKHKNEFQKSNFKNAHQCDELLMETLMTGTYGEMNAQEAVFRPYLGMGWNYLNGGGAVFSISYLQPSNWTLWFGKSAQSEMKL